MLKKRQGSRGNRIRVRGKVPQAQSETAFHFLISNRFGFLDDDDADEEDARGRGMGRRGASLLDASPAGVIGTSESRAAMVQSRFGSAETETERECVRVVKISTKKRGLGAI